MEPIQKANHLEGQKSAYLKHHQFQPVDWWPYCREALDLSQKLNRPIFLSIGYSSCHWCHVMAQESFEDMETAKFLNENFVCIKVDREEFPDIDRYYQDACQLFSQSGGWPLSAFLLPDQRPFFVGTYFPKKRAPNLPSFLDITKELIRAFAENKNMIEENAQKATEAIKEGLLPKENIQYQGHFPHPMSIMAALVNFKDKENGGYGKAPKFPQHAFHEWAVEQMLEGMIDKEEGEFIKSSINKMLMGGIIDQVRGGMHRYSVDEKWEIPHFEKMLYDQAGLLRVLSKLGLILSSPLIYDTMANTLDYLDKEMLSEKNFFFTSQDADSEGVEGLYYSFSETEFEDALAHSDDEELIEKRELLKKWFCVKTKGNFDHGLNVLRLNPEFKNDFLEQDGWNLVRKTRRAILNERKDRIPPETDTKGLSSWNFLMISALADIIQYCPIEFIKSQAGNLLQKIIEGAYVNFLVSKDTGGPMKILHSTSLGPIQYYLEDYVFFAEAMIRVYEVTANSVFKDNFNETMAYIIENFIEDNCMLTKVKGYDWPNIPNQKAHGFDSSYKSPRATFHYLLKRGAILNQNNEWFELAEKLKENLVQECLKNPLASGEALRALTYPDIAFRVLKVPKSWHQNAEFLRFLSYFLSRFVVHYIEETSESSKEEWQICNKTTCELQGHGVKSFIDSLVPTDPKKKEEK